MKTLPVMIKPAGALCNMQCAYCFYKDVSRHRSVPYYGCMSRDMAERVIDRLVFNLNKGDRISVTFQGGEPMLAGLEFFQHITDYSKKYEDQIDFEWGIQTNGLLVDARWCKFLKEKNFLVGLSYDLCTHGELRPDLMGRSTENRVLESYSLLKSYGIEPSILCVLTNSLAIQAEKVWERILELNIRHVQFIPCLEADPASTKKYKLTPENYARFYLEILPLWKKEYNAGKYISIQLIDDLFNLFGFGIVGACGLTGHCEFQIVIESNGDVYPCDFYAIDQFKLGCGQDDSLENLYHSEGMQKFRSRSKMDEICMFCRYGMICAGGCRRMADNYRKGDFCGHREIIDKTVGTITGQELPLVRHDSVFESERI